MINAETGERVHANAVSTSSPPLSPSLSRTDRSTESFWTAFSELSSLNIVKCALAYTIASLFVYTRLSAFLGTTASKHTIASVCVYFHPARTVGGMLQAITFAFGMLGWSLLVAFVVMAACHGFYDLNWAHEGATFLLILFSGWAFGMIGYFKVKVSNPTFDTACSVAVIFLVSVLLKEDDVQHGIMSLDQLFTYLIMALIGVTIAALVCVLIGQVRAETLVRQDMGRLVELYSTALEMNLNRFMMGRSTAGVDYDNLLKEITARLKKLRNNLMHAKYELYLSRRREEFHVLSEIVRAHERLTLHLSGLSHCTHVQADLLISKPLSGDHSSFINGQKISTCVLFKIFIQHLGPPMSSYVTTMSDILRQAQLGDAKINPRYRTNLQAARDLYSNARSQALRTVYKHQSFAPEAATSGGDEAVLATCGSFSYLLVEFAEELEQVLELISYYESLNDEWPLKPPSVLTTPPTVQTFNTVANTLFPRKATSTTWRYRLWRFLRSCNRTDVRHGIKVGIGGMLIAIPGYIPATRPYFKSVRGEWAVITYMLIMARNLGAMTTNIPYRVFGTLTGALLAVTCWQISHNSLWLIVAGSVTSMFCFYIILGQNRPALGRFILLTFNLVALFSYSLHKDSSTNDDEAAMDTITGVAFQRTTAVLAAIIWAVFVSVAILPNSARLALRRGFSVQWMRMGMIWKSDPLGTLPRRSNGQDTLFVRGISGELELQNMMLELQTLLELAPNEFRLRGKFDSHPYRDLYKATQEILGAYHHLAIISSQEVAATSKEVELVRYTQAERDDLCNTLFLQFYAAASSIRLGFPVPEKLPVPRQTIDEMFRKLQEHRRSLSDEDLDSGTDEDFVLFYSYLMVTITVIEQLAAVNDTLRSLYGAMDTDILFS